MVEYFFQPCANPIHYSLNLLPYLADYSSSPSAHETDSKPMIPSLLHPLPPPSATTEQPEDIFASSLGSLFRDATRDQHGFSGSGLIYSSTTFGDLYLALYVPDPESKECADEKGLFAHYVWNAGIMLAEVIGLGTGGGGVRDVWRERVGYEGGNGSVGESEGGFWRKDWNRRVRGARVMELGAGSGVVSLVCHLAGAEEVVCTDYPAKSILDCIRGNIARNMMARQSSGKAITAESVTRIPDGADRILAEEMVRVCGHKWGSFDDDISKSDAQKFDLIVAADVLWIDNQHTALLSSFEHFLTRDNVNAEGWIIAGFHTGREKIAGFINSVDRHDGNRRQDQDGDARLSIGDVWEVDMNGMTREWKAERAETTLERKKWLVMIVLKRKGRR